MKVTWWDILADQRKVVPPVVRADLSGKTVVVTGANTGIGFEAAKHFASMNPARLILGCRNKQKGEAALSKLKEETGYSRAELWLIDLAQFSSVKQFADRFEQEGGRLDILVENAGMPPVRYELTGDDWESALQVNHLGPAMLALLLLPKMLDTAKRHGTLPRLVIVASEVHYFANTDQLPRMSLLENLSSKEYCTPQVMGDRYNVVKLLNVLFTRAIAERLPSTSPTVLVDTVNPGYCISELRRNLSGMMAVISKIMDILVARTSEEGSRQLVWAAVGGSEDDEGMKGSYINLSQVAEPSDFVISKEGKEMQDRLWDETIDALSKVDQRIRSIRDKYLTRV